MVFHDISRVPGSTELLPTNAKVGAVYAQSGFEVNPVANDLSYVSNTKYDEKKTTRLLIDMVSVFQLKLKVGHTHTLPSTAVK